MKITKITTYRLPPRWMFLKIETDEGVVGWGEPVIEGRARTVEAAVHELGDYLIGQDRSSSSAPSKPPAPPSLSLSEVMPSTYCGRPRAFQSCTTA